VSKRRQKHVVQGTGILSDLGYVRAGLISCESCVWRKGKKKERRTIAFLTQPHLHKVPLTGAARQQRSETVDLSAQEIPKNSWNYPFNHSWIHKDQRRWNRAEIFGDFEQTVMKIEYNKQIKNIVKTAQQKDVSLYNAVAYPRSMCFRQCFVV
jgi:hypothetical protein